MNVKQTVLIFWKDVRYLWVELSVYVVLLAMFAAAAPQVWLGRSPNQFLALFVTLLKILMAVSWLVLIARAVHADSLVGQEQFWITRPYRWQSLLAAKTLFVALCLGMPFVIMQWAILLQAGLNPFAAKTGMAVCLLRFALDVILPFFVVASVTENLATTFTFVAAMMVTWAGLLTFILSGTDMRMSPPYSLAVFCVLFGGLMVEILIHQYARRRTMHSRWVIVGFLASFLLMVFGFDRQGFGAPVEGLIREHYAINDAVRLARADSVPYKERGEDMRLTRDQIELKLPVRIDGLPDDAKLRDPHIAVEIEGGGVRYASAWQSAVLGEDAVGFVIPKGVFERFVNIDASVHLEVIAEQLRPARVVQSVASEMFRGPMKGVCSLIEERVYCRYAYREWVPTRVEASACGGAIGATLRHVPAETTPDPVVNEAVPSKGKVCAGDLIRFTEYGTVGRLRLVLDMPMIRIGQYRAREQ